MNSLTLVCIEFAFIFYLISHWNHSGKWGVTTFIEVLSPWRDPGVTGFVAKFLLHFPFGPLPVLRIPLVPENKQKPGPNCFSWSLFADNHNVSFLYI